MEKRWDVLGFGVVAVDDLLYVERYPALNSKEPVLSVARQSGGLAGTALVAAAKLGARAAYCGVLGDDELSLFSLDNLQRRGVDCALVQRHPDARPVHSTVVVEQPSGQRSIFYYNREFREPDSQCITAELISACRVLFVDHTVMDTALRAAGLARQLGIPVVADIERAADLRLPQLLDLVDHLIVGVEIAEILTGEGTPEAMARALAAPWRSCAAVTAGEAGCWYAIQGGETMHCPALQVTVVDTTGCGDVFHGAYAAWIARGEPVARAIRAASVAAGLKAACRGGQDGIPDRVTVEKML